MRAGVDQMDALLEKVKTEPVRMVVLSPYWPKPSWFDEVSQLSECSHVLRREETRYVPRKGLPKPPAPHWETVLFRIDTVKQGISPADPNHTNSQETTTKKRKQRLESQTVEEKLYAPPSTQGTREPQ